ncbi:unnamed protein product [Gongylonema pulchrum]|uniref:E3 ubiquitin-protein ligase n=1 Tax=Gongylonema pulchrum TaxID=637853 RepID=A0A183DDN7_9BILA|nr:unnamed protein product [Gongylonema pulchrum]
MRIKISIFIRSNVVVELEDDEKCIFFYLHLLVQSVEWGQKNDRTRRVWEPTYTLIYGDALDNSGILDTSNSEIIKMNRIPKAVADGLRVISYLQQIAASVPEYETTADIFVSEKLTQKIMQILADPLIVSARALPSWSEELVYNYPCLFSGETRRVSVFNIFAFTFCIEFYISSNSLSLNNSKNTRY